MDIRTCILAALCFLLCACATLPTRVAPAAAGQTAATSRLKPCLQPDEVKELDDYKSSKQAYLDAGMDDEMSGYLAATATAMTLCIWHHEFNQFQGRTCSLALDFTSGQAAKSFSGDPALCAFIKENIKPVIISPPPASYLQQHKRFIIDFMPG
ncbi:hypothetical protein ACL2XP_23445 [Sodalis sp. RH21]|uniref:hypothetical protein n=1 Tax=unclassified Sodalis (in: enterobacteria) TaxID=2636512 RepID=UPI0039B6DF77